MRGGGGTGAVGFSGRGTERHLAYPARVVPLVARGRTATGRRRLSVERPEDYGKIQWLDRGLDGRLFQAGCRTVVEECPAMGRVITVSTSGVEAKGGRFGMRRVVRIHPFFWKIPPDIRAEIIAQYAAPCFEDPLCEKDATRQRTRRYLKDNPERAMLHLCWFAANRYGVRLEGGFRRWIEEGIKDYFCLGCWREFYAREIERYCDAMYDVLPQFLGAHDRRIKRGRLAVKRALSVFLFDGAAPARKG